MQNKVICIVGMAGSGKSIVSDELSSCGFSYLRFGQVTLDEIKRRNLDVTAANEKKIREKFRKKYGMGAFATLNIGKIDEFLKKSNVVVDGLYSWTEYKVLKEKYGESMRVIAVFASPKLRYERLEKRIVSNDPDRRFRALSEKEAKERDYAEIENIEKGGPIAMADFTIINEGTISEVKKALARILKKISK